MLGNPSDEIKPLVCALLGAIEPFECEDQMQEVGDNKEKGHKNAYAPHHHHLAGQIPTCLLMRQYRQQ